MPEATLATVSVPRRGGEPRLRDLWLLVGSRCNLACLHCYVGSSPTNDTIEALTSDEVRAAVDEAAQYGVEHVYFTGGEPFLVADIIASLEYALRDGREVTVLTNATAPLERRFGELLALHREAAGRLTMRVSLDHYERARHDAIRGRGQFDKTVHATAELARAGVRTIVTTTAEVFRGNPISAAEVDAAFRALFPDPRVELDVKVLPVVLEMGSQLTRIDEPRPAERLDDAALAARGVCTEGLMCATGRSVLKRDGRVRIFPCPIIYEGAEYDLGDAVGASLEREVPLTHRACGSYCCPASGPAGTCTNA